MTKPMFKPTFNIHNKFLTKKFFEEHFGEFDQYLIEYGFENMPQGIEFQLMYELFIMDKFINKSTEKDTKKMHNITSDKIVKAIAESKFAQMCVDKDYAFDIVVEGVKFEIRPRRCTCGYGEGAVAHALNCDLSDDIEFDIY